MSAELKKIKQTTKDLQRLQDDQAKAVDRIGSMQSKLEKSSRKMQTLEAKIARLEQRVHDLRKPDSQPIARYAGGLRPARLIINPNSGGFTQQIGSPDKLVEMLRSHGIQAEVYLKTTSKAVRRWAREAGENDEELVIVAGGDGTIEDAAFALIGSRTILGILPTGTMNNLARGLGIPLDLEQACAVLGAGIIRQIDVGCLRGADGAKGAHFLETAGIGMSIAWPTGQNIKKGRWGKIPEAFRRIFEISQAPTQIELDNGEILETQVKLVTVSNAPLFGLNNLIAPDAKMDDGFFDLAVYDGLNNVELADYFLRTANGTRVTNPNVRFYRTRRAKISSQQIMPVTSDKDELPAQVELSFELIPRALYVIAGKGFGLNWPVEVFHSVPPLAGAQAAPKNEPIEQAKGNGKNGAEPLAPKAATQPAESPQDNAR